MNIVVLGSVNVDVTAYSPRLPRPGETILGETYAMALGGKGANQAVAAARLGARVDLVGRTGKDMFGNFARACLAETGVLTRALHEDPVHGTGIAVIGVDRNAENCITVIGGANMAVGQPDLLRLIPLLAFAKVLLLQLEVPLAPALDAALQMRAQFGLTILDPAPAPAAGLPDKVWRYVDVMTPNETETEALVGIRPVDRASAARAAAALVERGLRIAVVKMGGSGVYYRAEGEEGFVPPFPVKAIDTVAAGDSFNGGLAFALARGDGPGEAVRFAAACGALATTRRGASQSAPTLAEVEALMAGTDAAEGLRNIA